MVNTEAGALFVVDAESSVVEPPSVWSEYVDPQYRIPVRSVFFHDVGDAGPYWFLNGAEVAHPERMSLARDASWRPDGGAGEGVTPGASDAGARLADMDAMGVTAAVLFPYYFSELFPVVRNPDVAAALATAYNRWIWDFASADRGRLVPAAVLPLQSTNLALAELHRVVDRGFTTVSFRPVFTQGRSLADPTYDPLWQAIAESGTTVAIRPTQGSLNAEWTSFAPFVDRVSTGFGLADASFTISPMMDNGLAIIELMAFAHLTRFEGLRLVFTNSQASWLPVMLEKSEGYLTLMTIPPTYPTRTDSDELFYEKGVKIQFDGDESAVARLHDQFVNAAVWGSHYPRVDTLSAVESIANLEAAGVPASAVARMMGANAASAYDIALPSAA